MRTSEGYQRYRIDELLSYLDQKPAGDCSRKRWETLLSELGIRGACEYPEGAYSPLERHQCSPDVGAVNIPDRCALIEFLRDQGGISEKLALEYLTQYTLEQMEGFH